MKNHQKSPQQGRRKFLGHAGITGVATLAAAATNISIEPLLGGKESVAEAATGNSGSSNRANDSFTYRITTAQAEKINIGSQSDNGDTSRFTDFSGSYSKALLHDSFGVPNTLA